MRPCKRGIKDLTCLTLVIPLVWGVPGADNLPIHHAPNITNAYQFWACSYSIAAVRATVQKQIDACALHIRKSLLT